jgi:hypothetical protein
MSRKTMEEYRQEAEAHVNDPEVQKEWDRQERQHNVDLSNGEIPEDQPKDS